MSASPVATEQWEVRLGVTRSVLETFCHRWGLSQFALFGSITRDDFTPESDVDVMVRLDPTKPHGGWDWVDMKEELEAMFRRRVDLTSQRVLENPYRRIAIERDLRVVYAA